MADRRVRRLRLAAACAADVRHLLPRLEDAFRCASLADSGGQVLLVRRLALGRLPRDASAQTLALLIERRVAAIGGTWRDGGDPAAGRADCVRFASRFEARLLLALRLARGQDATAWYWRLAVPEYRPEATATENLRALALALAALPEARAALPAWAARLADAGAAAALAAAIPDALGLALLRQAGLVVAGRGGAATAPADAARPRRRAPAHAMPLWLDVAWAHSGRAGQAWAYGAPGHDTPPGPAAVPTADRPAPHGTLRRPPDAQAMIPAGTAAAGTDPGDTESGGSQPGGRTTGPKTSNRAGRDRVRPVPTPRDAEATPAHPAALEGWPQSRGDPASGTAARRHIEAARWAAGDGLPWRQPTTAGGLLFLLPLLERLGIAAWAEAQGMAGEGFAQRVLARAARRLRIAVDDPVWQLLELPPGSPCRRPARAPVAWADPLLAPPRGRHGAAAPSQELRRARQPDAQAEAWLTAARRWLRRGGRIGLASLVLRPARLSLSPTHVDLHFRLQDTDLRVRRLGLDIDPGWLPWFGRVVTFHFDLPGAT